MITRPLRYNPTKWNGSKPIEWDNIMGVGPYYALLGDANLLTVDKFGPKAEPVGEAIEVDPIYCAGCGQPKPVDEFSSVRRFCGAMCKTTAQR